MPFDRRDFMLGSLALAGAALSPAAVVRAAGPAGEPILYRVSQGSGTVHMLGFSEATDNDWFVPKIAAALDAADTLWLETPPGSASAAAEGESSGPPADPELQRIFAERAFDPAHNLFDVLPPPVSARTGKWADTLKVTRDSLAPMRPWFARITLQQAYAAQRQAKADDGGKTVFPERIVVERARQRGIPIESEYMTIADLLRFFAELSDAAQPQYLEELYDYFDRDAAGNNDAGKYGWITGQPSTLSIDQQRERTPDLYRAMHVERNAWWTGRIEGMLAAGKNNFIMIGGNHVLGPDSIPVFLRKRGLPVEEV